VRGAVPAAESFWFDFLRNQPNRRSPSHGLFRTDSNFARRYPTAARSTKYLSLSVSVPGRSLHVAAPAGG
jgi:hypothetical protein